MVHFYSRIAFVCGLLVGIILAALCSHYLKVLEQNSPSKMTYSNWFKNKRMRKTPLQWDYIRYKNSSFKLESDLLFDLINVQCVMLVRNKKNAEAATNTWLKGCNDVKFINLHTNSKIMPQKRKKENSSWVLLCKALNELGDFDWTFVVNDYTFVIMENFRYYVAPLNADADHYLGHAVKFWGTLYNDGQSGYVLSRGALKKFKDHVGNERCEEAISLNKEDYQLGKHLNSIHITPINTQDSKGLSTFHPYNWYKTFLVGEGYKMSAFPVKCCSENAITFQAIEGDKMYTYYYLLYQLQIFSDGNFGNKAPVPIPDEQVWKGFLKERDIKMGNVSSKKYYKIWEDYIEDPNSFAKNMKRELHLDYV